jgi:hypothetical protein
VNSVTYTFVIDMNLIMYYASMIFNILMPVGGIAIGINFGVGLMMLLISVIKGAISNLR